MNCRLLLLSFILAPALLHAEARYVTDQFNITLRSGESTNHKIIKMLPSGTRLELLEENPESRYSLVRTADDETGYVLTRQLLTVPVAREQLTTAEKRIQQLKLEPEQLRQQLTQLQGEHRRLQLENDQALKDNNLLANELEVIKITAADAIKISSQRKSLANKVSELNLKLETLTQENTLLQDKTRENWFLIGAGVVTGGILLGLLIPYLRPRRRKDSWGSL